MSKKTSLTFVKKAYTIDYMLKNPPTNSKGLRYVWQTAVMEYMNKEGVDLSDKKVYHKPIQGIDFSKIVRIFNTLVGKPAPRSKSKRVA